MELRHLRTFLAIFEAGTISGAARQLHVAQPAVSRQLRQLETQLGVDLFDREFSGVVPTPAALRLEPEARRLLAGADVMVEAVRADGDTMGGTVRVALPSDDYAPVSRVVIAAYRAAYPNVELVVDRTCGYDAIASLCDSFADNHDVALWAVNREAKDLAVVPIVEAQLKLAVSARSELADAVGPVSVNDVLDLTVPRAAHPFVTRWASEFALGSFRNGSSPRFGQRQTASYADVARSIAKDRCVLGVWSNAKEMAGAKVLDIAESPTMPVGAIHRHGERRQHVLNFAAVAKVVGRELCSWVPGVVPVA